MYQVQPCHGSLVKRFFHAFLSLIKPLEQALPMPCLGRAFQEPHAKDDPSIIGRYSPQDFRRFFCWQVSKEGSAVVASPFRDPLPLILGLLS